MSTPEEVSGSHALTTAEQLFCTLSAWHEKVSVYIKGGVANVIGARWRVYAINGSQRTLLFDGSSKTLLNEVVVNAIPGQGDTIALYGFNPFGVTGSVKAYMVGWDPTAAVTPVQASTVGGVTLTLAEQDLGTLTGGYVNLDVAFNANGDPLAAQAQIRLYAILGGADRFQLEKFQVPDITPVPAGSVNLLQNYVAGASSFVITAQGRLGNSAITVTGTVEGETGSAGAGGGGGPPAGSYWPTQVDLAASVTTPLLVQAAATSDAAPQDLHIRAQDALPAATVHTTGGDLYVQSGAPATQLNSLGGAIHFRVNDSGDSLAVNGSGTIDFTESIAGPQYVVRNGVRTPVVISGNNFPAPSTVDPGSLFLSNTYNGLYVQAGDESTWNPVPILDATGSITLDPASTTPGVSQVENAVGAGTNMRFISQAAHTGSTTSGGDMSFILAADDPPSLYPTNPRLFWFGTQTVLGGHEPATNYCNTMMLKWLPGGVANLVLGGGTNDVGGGVAGAEISSFTQLSIATENDSRIITEVAGVGPSLTSLNRTAHDATDEAAFTLEYTENHATSGDAAGLQIIRHKTAIGAGVERYIDLLDGATRQFSIKPYVLGGAILNVEAGGGYLTLAAPHVVVSTADFEVLNAGVFGFKVDGSAAQLVTDTGVANSSWQFSLATVPVAQFTGSKFKTQQGRNRHLRTSAVDLTVLVTDEVALMTVTGKRFTLPTSPVAGDTYVLGVVATLTAGATFILDGNGINVALDGSSAATQTITTSLTGLGGEWKYTVMYNGTVWDAW